MQSNQPHTILLVEDDFVDAKAATRALKKAPFPLEVTVANSLSEARECLSHRSFDIALLDYKLGPDEGLSLMDDLGTTPAIIATGSGNEDIAVQAMRKGVYDYVVKDGAGKYLTLLPRVVFNVLLRRRAEMERDKLIVELRQAVNEIKTLQDFIPMCFKCKKVRDSEGYWKQLENYITEHTDAKITHGLCEHCLSVLSAELDTETPST